MEQKASVSFDTQYLDADKKPLPQPLTTLTIAGELMPDSPMVHYMLAALLDKDAPPKVEVRFKNEANRITYAVVFSHPKNVVAEGLEAHDQAAAIADNRLLSDDAKVAREQQPKRTAKLEEAIRKAKEKAKTAA